MAVGSPWPVSIVSLGPTAVTCGAVKWRAAAETRLTVVVKATFALVPGAAMKPVAPDPIIEVDVHHQDDPRRSLRAASEIAPYLAQAELLVTGHAYALQGRPAQGFDVQVALMREGRRLLDKSLRVQGDRQAPGAPPSPFQHMPLLHERATGDSAWNPVGVRPGAEPNLTAAGQHAYFGPIARTWPGRRQKIGAIDPKRFEGRAIEIPDGFDWSYFQAAPPDQRIEFLRGDELLMLGGMNPHAPLIKTQLPGARAVARLYTALPPTGPGAPISLWADTLCVDTDRQLCSVIWRGNAPIDERAIDKLSVLVGLELPGLPVVFPDGAAAPRPAAAVAAPAPEDPLEGTQIAKGPPKAPALPFAKAPPAQAAKAPPAKPAAPPARSQSDDDDPLTGTVVAPQGMSKGPALPFAKAAPPAPPPPKPSASPPQSQSDDDDPLTGTVVAPQGMSKGPALPFAKAPQGAPPAPPKAATEAPARSDDDDPLTGTVMAPQGMPKSPALPFAKPSAKPVAAPPSAPIAAPPIAAPPPPAPIAAPPSAKPAPPSAKPALPAPPAKPAPPPAKPDEEDALEGTVMASKGMPKAPALPFMKGVAKPAPPGAAKPAPPSVRASDDPLTGTIMASRSTPKEAALPFVSAGPPVAPEPERTAPLPGEPPPIPPRHSDSIPIINRTPLVVVTIPWQVRPPQDSLTVIVKGSFALVPGGAATLLPESDLPFGDEHFDDDLQRSLRRASDFAVFKPKADVTLVGRAVAPGGSSPAAEVRFKLGKGKNAFARRLVVFGDRAWQKSVITLAPTEPRPFEAIPLVYENAFGGPGFDANPTGTGATGGARLPNLEDPAHLIKGPGDRPAPACFAPIPVLWKERWSKLGTYDGAWLRDRWPYFPDDFDWTHFQSAPPSQQLDHLAGDEPFEVTGVSAAHPKLDGQLPGLRARCFLQRTPEAGGTFEEVVLRLDTVAFDTDALKVNLVWRGIVEVRDEDAPEIAALFAMTEPLAGPLASLVEARERFLAALLPLAPVEEPLESEPANELVSEKDPEQVALEAMIEARRAEIAEAMKKAGIPDDPPTPAPPPDPAKIAETLRATGRSEEEIARMLAMLASKDEEPEGAQPAPDLRARVIAMLEAGEALDDLDLAGADLSDLDLEGRSLVGADLRGAKLHRCRLGGARLAGALLAKADLTDAVLDAASLTTADFTEAVIDGASLRGADLTGADFSGARGSGANFEGAMGAGPTFAGAELPRARFVAARLPSADFTGAMLEQAVFTSAEMPDIMLYDARAAGALFEEAQIGDARGDGVDLSKASLRKVNAPGSIWEGAKLDGASFLGGKLAGSSFVRASCAQASFAGADMVEAVLRRAKLQKANLFKANLMAANLSRADLTGADLRGANLHGAEVWRAKLDGADLGGAIVTRSKLGRRP